MAIDTDLTGSFHQEDLILQTARGLAAEVGLTPVSEATGALLALLAAASPAKSVVEIGTGTGVSGLWLLRGMRSDGVLTTIDIEGEYQRMARRLFTEAGFPSARTRIITGRALEVLPRLSDGIYDLIFIDGDRAEGESYVEAAGRLLRKGGLVILRGTHGATSIRDSGLWAPAVIPSGDGLVAAIRL
ncbi:O-methyltransferase [Catelliglobosispora koreensis]|uniref:O-methyltransferase n=1 Tax=Catelliglobosispora koreensis TaxID=129052 RepID=UPI00037891A3|nr:class I SAM-dependent methyltransferase [Catelliglobosispora koreensis]